MKSGDKKWEKWGDDEISKRNAEAIEFVRNMTMKERFQLAVDAGIYTPDGKLSPEYRQKE